jgi:hypothetical protein
MVVPAGYFAPVGCNASFEICLIDHLLTSVTSTIAQRRLFAAKIMCSHGGPLGMSLNRYCPSG